MAVLSAGVVGADRIHYPKISSFADSTRRYGESVSVIHSVYSDFSSDKNVLIERALPRALLGRPLSIGNRVSNERHTQDL